MFNQLIAASLPYMPKAWVGRIARRYIAGSHPEDAYRVSSALIAEGYRVTVDLVGEDITSENEARDTLDKYLKLIAAMREWEITPEDASISLKPSQFGLMMSSAQGSALIRQVVEMAVGANFFVRLDMEGSATTEAILDLYHELHQDFPGRIGCVLQSMLFRTQNDAHKLTQGPNHDVRLCKGIYREDEDTAWQAYQGIRDNYMTVAKSLLQGGVKVRMATHDLWLVERIEQLAIELNIPPAQIEFQALLGVPIQKTLNRLKEKGFPVRIYIPYGTAWYPYSLRRLKENPAVAGHVLRGLFSRQR